MSASYFQMVQKKKCIHRWLMEIKQNLKKIAIILNIRVQTDVIYKTFKEK